MGGLGQLVAMAYNRTWCTDRPVGRKLLVVYIQAGTDSCSGWSVFLKF